MGHRILILDDPHSDLRLLADAFREAAGRTSTIEVVTDSKALFDKIDGGTPYHLIVIEDRLEGDSRGGIRMLRLLRKQDRDLPIVLVIEEGNEKEANEVVEAGATDFLYRGKDLVRLVRIQLKKINRLIDLVRRNRELQRQFQYLEGLERSRFQMVGDSPQFREIFQTIRRVAAIPRPVLITGERGTGKELVARAIHNLAAAGSAKPMVVVNCAAFTDNLLESELFGHEAGAFSGAANRYGGKFEQADGGTLFLDEIGNMSLNFQQKIMRVVEYGTFHRVGGRSEIKVDTRVIAATNADLKRMMEEGRFLRDLYDRLSFEVIHVPPLRLRKGDIELLANFFLRQFMEEIPDFQGKRFSEEAFAMLRRYKFPGNVRELKNIVERAVYRDTTNQITPEDLGLKVDPAEWVGGDTFKEKVEAFELHLIQNALGSAGGNQAEAARRLGLSYHQFRHYAKKYADRIES